VEDASNNYIKSGPKGQFDNPITARKEAKKYRAEWKKTYAVFEQLRRAGNVATGRNPYLIYISAGGLELTPAGIEKIKKTFKVSEIDPLIMDRFEKLLLAQEMRREQSDPDYLAKKKAAGTRILSEQDYRYRVEGRDIYVLDDNGRMEPGKKFGGGIDEALRLIYGFKL
jgi:hypothetical protein